MSEAESGQLRRDYFPPPLAGAALAAFAMLYLTPERRLAPPLIPIFAAMLLLPCITKVRLPRSRWYAYGLRAILFAIVLLVLRIPKEDTSFWYFKRDYTDLGGYLLAAEMVVQSWRWHDWSEPAEATGVALLLTALIAAAGCNTFDMHHTLIQRLCVVYLAMLILIFRRFSARQRMHRRPALIVLRLTAAVFALSLSYGAVEVFQRLEYGISRLAVKYLYHGDSRGELGLSDTPSLGAVHNPHQSLARVLVIDGDLPDPHLRALAFDTYENQTWRPALRERNFTPVGPDQLHPNAPGLRCQITPVSEADSILLTNLNSTGVDADFAVTRDSQGVLDSHDSDGISSYALVSPKRPNNQGPLCIAPDPAELGRLGTVPGTIDPRVIALARQVAGQGDDYQRLSRLVDYLEAHNSYSMRYFPEGEPISDFILNHRAAHCEYFASAMVIMSRAIGIPARFVTGYYAHEHEGSEIVVRGRDAHAWAEMWVKRIGWVSIDPTPAAGTPAELCPQPGWITRAWDAITDLPWQARRLVRHIGRNAIIAVALGAILLAAIISFVRSLLTKNRTPRRRFGVYANASQDLQAAAARFERALRARGIELRSTRTWRESVRQAPPVFAEFVDFYDTLRFGTGGSPQRLQSLLEQIEQESSKSNQ